MNTAKHEFELLLQAVLESRADERPVQRFQELLRQDSSLRATHLTQARVHALLT